MKIHKFRRGGVVGLLMAAALLAGVAPASAAPGDGSAFAAMVNVSGPLGVPTVNLGPLAASNTNGPTSNNLASFNASGLASAGVMTTSAVHDVATGEVKASAETANLKIGLGPLSGSAGAIKATCTATQAGVTGTSTLAQATLAGMTLPVNPAPNTTLNITVPNPVPLAPPIAVATLVLNEQIKNADGSLTVNAFHLKLLTGSVVGNLVGQGEIIISSATCGPASPPIPLASGAGLWIGLGLLGLAVIPVGWAMIRRRRFSTAA